MLATFPGCKKETPSPTDPSRFYGHYSVKQFEDTDSILLYFWLTLDNAAGDLVDPSLGYFATYENDTIMANTPTWVAARAWTFGFDDGQNQPTGVGVSLWQDCAIPDTFTSVNKSGITKFWFEGDSMDYYESVVMVFKNITDTTIQSFAQSSGFGNYMFIYPASLEQLIPGDSNTSAQLVISENKESSVGAARGAILHHEMYSKRKIISVY